MKKVEMSLGEVLDRLSILTMKVHFGDEQSISEHRHLTQSLESYGIDGRIMASSLRLQLMNRLIWELEHEMRKGHLDSDLPEMGRRAIKIRDFNAKRIEYKNEINRGGFMEKKIQHRSER
jgi:hypothetical protein